MTGLIPTFGNLLFTVAAFVVALSIIVAIHEYGHYIVGRWSGIRAEVFSVGFGPVLWSRMDRRGTRWQIAAIPFGGYVKFLGDASAASDRPSEDFDRLSADEKRHTMHGAPLWARAATVAAGPVFNFVLSLVLFAALIGWRGIETEPPTVARILPLPAASASGLQPGDTILAIADRPVATLEDLSGVTEGLEPGATVGYRVLREGRETEVSGPWPTPPLAGSVSPETAAQDAGIETGDVILSVDGMPVYDFNQLPAIVEASGGRELSLEIWREGEVSTVVLAPKRTDLPKPDGTFETRWLIGLSSGYAFELATETPGPVEAVTIAARQISFVVTSSVSTLTHVIAGKISTCNVRGPVGIAKASAAMANEGLVSFLWFVAVLSTAVGFLNLFPIPVLDGGHLVFHAYEAIARRPPSDGALRILMTVGLALILGLMAFALSNDFSCP